MKDFGWNWVFAMLLLILGISIFILFLLLIGFTIYAIFYLHYAVVFPESFQPILLIVVVFVSSVLLIGISSIGFKRENSPRDTITLSKRLSRILLYKIGRGRVFTKIQMKGFCENWRLSHYKMNYPAFLSILFIIIFIFVFVNPHVNINNNIYLQVFALTILISVFVSLFFTFYYSISARSYCIKTPILIEAFCQEPVNTRNNIRGQITIAKRNKIKMDISVIRFLLANFNMGGFTREEATAIDEFNQNLIVFKRFIISSEKKPFRIFAGFFEKAYLSLCNDSKKHEFLKRYYELRKTYEEELRIKQHSLFDASKLYDRNKALSWEKFRREFGSLKATQIFSVIIFPLISVIVLALLVYTLFHQGAPSISISLFNFGGS